jgi:hypothetical protein
MFNLRRPCDDGPTCRSGPDCDMWVRLWIGKIDHGKFLVGFEDFSWRKKKKKTHLHTSVGDDANLPEGMAGVGYHTFSFHRLMGSDRYIVRMALTPELKRRSVPGIPGGIRMDTRSGWVLTQPLHIRYPLGIQNKTNQNSKTASNLEMIPFGVALVGLLWRKPCLQESSKYSCEPH